MSHLSMPAAAMAVSHDAPARRRRTTSRHKRLLALLAGLLSLLPIVACGSTPVHDWAGAWVVCEDFVEQRLVSPGSAKFADASQRRVQHNGAGRYTVTSYVDAQNALGGLMRVNYTCIVEHASGNQQYRLVDLQMQQQ